MNRLTDVPAAFVESHFSPSAYNATYFTSIMEDEAALLDWLVTMLPTLLGPPQGQPDLHLLDVGCGPTVHRMLAFEPFVQSIELSDLMAHNLAEIHNWLRQHPEAHDWSHFTSAVHELERRIGSSDIPPTTSKREDSLRAKVSGLNTIDLRQPSSLRIGHRFDSHVQLQRTEFDVVTSFFCADSATSSTNEFTMMIANAAGHVSSGGWFIGSALGGCRAYRVGDHWLPSPALDANDLTAALIESGVAPIEITRFDTPQLADDGFDHIFAFVGRRT
ncbi:MAG TPA: hypothetical protein VES40_21235 [Ilumatobacteraceae bacterium]|nr:hypothetical protein [Ilumatobacteraceae bacterium]